MLPVAPVRMIPYWSGMFAPGGWAGWRALACLVLGLVAPAGCGDSDSGGPRIETLAGGLTIGDGGPATATFLDPQGLTVDEAGNVFVLDRNDVLESVVVRRVDAGHGIITTVAGGCERSSDGRPATEARGVCDVRAIAARGVKALVAQTVEGQLFSLDTVTGAAQHLAGRGGEDCTEPDGASALDACLGGVGSIALDAGGTLYLADFGRVRRLDTAAPRFDVVAGKVFDGFCVDGPSGPDGLRATDACISPRGIALDRRGDLVMIDGGLVRRVDGRTGLIATIAGGDGDCQGARGDGGPAESACFRRPRSIAVASTGDFFVSDADSVRLIRADSGVISTVATGSSVEHVAIAPDDSLVFTEAGRVNRLDVASHQVTPLAGNGTASLCGEGGPADRACLGRPRGVALDPDGNIYFADGENARIGRVDAATGLVTTVAGGRRGFCGDEGPALHACFRDLSDLVLDADGNLFVADRSDDDRGEGAAGDRIRRIEVRTGTITTIAGACTAPGSARAFEACLYRPTVLLVDATGGLLVGESTGVRRIDLASNTLRDVAGGDFPALECSADGIPARESCLIADDLALDAAGNLFVLDFWAALVRRIDAATGLITTVAGGGVSAFCGEEDGPALAACLFPSAIAVDDAGRLIIATGGVLRAVDPGSGRIRTIAGGLPDGRDCLTSPTTPDDGCLFPSDLEIDARGRLLFADPAGRRIQRLTVQ